MVVKKIAKGSGLYLSSQYVHDYQLCEVVQSPEDSKYDSGDEVFVGRNICFDQADHFGKGSYYIDISEVFGHVIDGVIVPSSDIVFIEADKDKKSVITIGGKELFNDTTYNPLDSKNVSQDGKVLSVCDKAKHSVFQNDLEVEIAPGDHIYAHHFLTREENEREFNGKKYYSIRYEDLYCRIDNGIHMLNNWNFVVPVLASNDPNELGIITELNKKNELRVGVIKHPNKSLSVDKEEKVFFKRGREYEIDVEGETYYRIDTNDILCKFDNMEALGEIIIVEPIQNDYNKGGFITSVEQNPIPEKGKVLSVGEEVSSLKGGETILFRKMASTEVEIEGKKVLLMSYKSAYAIV